MGQLRSDYVLCAPRAWVVLTSHQPQTPGLVDEVTMRQAYPAASVSASSKTHLETNMEVS